MLRRAAPLVLTFTLSAALLLVLALVDNRMWDEGGPGIVGFELAWTEHHVDRILAEWGDSGRDAARLSLWLDFPFLVAYSAFWALLLRRLRPRSRVWMAAPVAGAFDLLEDICLLVVLGGSGGGAMPFLAALFATLKFLALAAVLGSAALVFVRRFPRAAALGGAVVVVALAVNAVLVDRATEPARPDIGRVLHLRAGDIQVREDGPRSAPPVVLVHGFAVSLRWWDEVVPALSRRLHVVRVDLLGHGGSEKPRDGYSMENQADVVAEAMRALGIRRAPIVGHSMGGIVGTAFVERHRDMVSRLMMIGTAPDRHDERLDLLASAAFWPVIGEANDTLITDRLVRWTVEAGFAPEFDPPQRLVKDIFDRTTWNAFHDSAVELQAFWDERPLTERLRGKGVPVTVLLGEEERHTRRSTRLYNSIGARTVVMQDLDHTPQVEAPERTAPLIEGFALGR